MASFALWALAQEKGPQRAPLLIGWVDQERLLEGFKDYQREVQAYREMFERRRRALEQLNRDFLFLSESEWKEAINLLIKEKLTDKEKARLEELRKLSRERERELQTLESKAQPTEKEKARIRELRSNFLRNRQSLAPLQQKWQSELEAHDRATSARLEKRIVETVKKVAQERGFDVVLYTDPPKVIYVRPDLDLTDPVLKILNQGK